MAFATILAVVAGLVIASSGAVAHDFFNNVPNGGRLGERAEINTGPVATGVGGSEASGAAPGPA